MNKKNLTIAGVVLVIVLIGFLIANQYNLFVRNSDTPPADSNVVSQDKTDEEIQKQQEEERLQKEKEEAERLQKEEAERIAKEEARQQDIEDNTWYVGPKGFKVYDALKVEEAVEIEADSADATEDTQLETTETIEPTLIATLDPKTKVYVSDYIQDSEGHIVSVEIKSDVDAVTPIGYGNYGELVKEKSAFITRPYEDADYSAFEKTSGYDDNPPIEVKGLYVTGHSAAGDKMTEILKIIDETDINAVVIDVKDDNGFMLFHSDAADQYNPKANDHVYIDDITSFINELKSRNVYLIARIVTFKSPIYAKENLDKAIIYKGGSTPYTDGDGIYWASAHNRELWEYNVAVAKEAADVGFNEIQFDYVRFPAISNKDKMDFRNTEDESQAATIQKFLKYAYAELSPKHVYISADVFGWAATAINDVGIGQHWEAVSNVVDYMCPMMYPSHYGPNNYGLSVPDAYPYETIDRSVKDAIERNDNIETPGKIRPWIQDFTATWVKGHIKYGVNEVKAQIQALEDNGIHDYIIWNSANRYSVDAFKSE